MATKDQPDEAWLRNNLSPELLQRAAAMNVPAARRALNMPPLYERVPFWELRNLKEPAAPASAVDPIPGDPCPECWKGLLKDITPPSGPVYTPNADSDYVLVRYTLQCPDCQWLMNGRDYRKEALYENKNIYERSLTTEQPLPILEKPAGPRSASASPSSPALLAPATKRPPEARFASSKIGRILNFIFDDKSSLSPYGRFAIQYGLLSTLLALEVPFPFFLIPLVILLLLWALIALWNAYAYRAYAALRSFWSRATSPTESQSPDGNSARTTILLVAGLLLALSLWAAPRLHFQNADALALAALTTASISGLIFLRVFLA